MEKSREFAFKRGLYNISNKLTTSDIDKMKFILSDFLPRQQLEKAMSGFDLLCLMASRSDILSCNDYSFLQEVLMEVGKGDCVEGFLSSYSLHCVLGSPCVTHHLKSELVKVFLGELADNLTAENVHDLILFFSGICESINYQNMHNVRSAEQLFSRLLECHIIGASQLQPLQEVLTVIGRLDLADQIEIFNAGSWQSIHPEEKTEGILLDIFFVVVIVFLASSSCSPLFSHMNEGNRTGMYCVVII